MYLSRICQWREWEYRNLENQRMKIVDESILFFSRVSQNSLWKLSTIRGYKGYLYWCVFEMWKISFSQIEWFGDLTSRLNWIASLSRELTTWPNWKFCPVMLQLAWLFSSFACFTRVPPLATCYPLASRKTLLSAHSWTFLHTLSHTTLTWFSHKYNVSKFWITSKLARNKANKMVY